MGKPEREEKKRKYAYSNLDIWVSEEKRREEKED